MIPFHCWQTSFNKRQKGFQRSLGKLKMLKKYLNILQIYIQRALISNPCLFFSLSLEIDTNRKHEGSGQRPYTVILSLSSLRKKVLQISKLAKFYFTLYFLNSWQKACVALTTCFPHLFAASSFSCIWLFVTPLTVAYQAPPPMGFPRQECWSGLPSPSYLQIRHPSLCHMPHFLLGASSYL